MARNRMEPEFEQRLVRVRKSMSEHGIDALLVYSQKRAHVRYITGYSPNYHTNSALLLVTLSEEPTLWIKFGFDLARAKMISWVEDVRVAPHEDARALVTECAKTIRQLDLERSRIGLVASDLAVDEMSISLNQCIRNEIPRAEIEPASDIVNLIRLKKSRIEVDQIRRSTRLAEEVVVGLQRAIRPGRSDLSAVVAAEQVARNEGARCDIIISTDESKLAFPPRKVNFRKRTLVNCEITVELDGYWVQLCRTFCIGRPSPNQQRIFAVSRKAYGAGLAAARYGNKVQAVWRAIHDSISRDGCEEYVQYGPGHGVGLDLPELYPIEQECEANLDHNMILIIHPGIWAPGQGAGWTGGPIVVGNGAARTLDRPQTEIIEI